jgi:hypothetical protein
VRAGRVMGSDGYDERKTVLLTVTWGAAVVGEAWDVPPMLWDTVLSQPASVWRCVESKLLDGWGDQAWEAIRIEARGFTARAMRPLKPSWLTPRVATTLHEMGAPVQQLFTACVILARHR